MTESADKNLDTGGQAGFFAPTQSLKFRLQVLLLLVALPAIILIVLLGVLERQHVMNTYRDEARHVTDKLVLRQTRLVKETQSFLTDLANTPAVRTASDPACGTFLALLLPLQPQFINIAVAQAGGDVLCSAKPLHNNAIISDEPYIRRALEHEVLSVGSLQIDPDSDGVGVKFAYPVKPDPDSASPIAAVVAVVSLDWWNNALADEGLPEGTMALITDSAGQIIAIFPENKDVLGSTVTEVGFTEEIFWNGAGEGEFVNPSGSLKRIFFHQPLFTGSDQGRVQMSLGLPVNGALVAGIRRVAIQLALFAGTLVVCWLITLRLLERSGFRPLNVLSPENQQRKYSRGGGNAPKSGQTEQLRDTGAMTQGSRDVSKKQEPADAARVKHENHLDALLEAVPDNYFLFDKQGTILDYRLSLGITWVNDPDLHFGQSFADILPPAVGKRFSEKFRKLHETKGFVTWTNELDVDGIRQVRECRLCPIAGSDESILLVRDVTKRHLAEERRAETEARFQRIITNLPGMVVSRRIVDSEIVKISYVSPQCEDIWGYTQEEIYADFKILEASIAPEELHEMIELAVRAADELEPYAHRFKITTRSGEVKWLETNTSAYRQEDGSIITDGILIDVTAEIEVQQQLEKERSVSLHAQKLESIGQMTGGVAHDFNNLLAAVMGSLELLRDDLSDEEHLTLIDAGISAAQRGAELTRAMLAYARRARLEPKVIDLNRMVNETRKWAGRALPSSIDVETSLLTGLWPTKADVSSTESALLNLILNARDAMPKGGALTIETTNVHIDENDIDSHEEEIEPGRYVALSVSDTGKGMSEKTLAHIFEPFFTTKPIGSGSGLGLPMTMGFMRQSGGTVRAQSELGVGSTVKLLFKALDEELVVPEAAPIPAKAHPSENQEILVAEDEASVRIVLIAILKKAGFNVTAASSGDEALALFKAKPTFDLLLTDMAMPGRLQGLALSMAIREIAPEIPVVFMSGNATETTDQSNGLQQGDTRLMKPVLRADLLATINKSLGR